MTTAVTHYEGCWRVHLECSVKRVEALQEALTGLEDEVYSHATAAGYLEHRSTVLRLQLQEVRRRVRAV